MEHRTSFALDDGTIRRLKKLARLWHVSQAEAVRRAIERAETELATQVTERLERLQAYHDRGGLEAASAEAWLAELAEQRRDWGRQS